jgi:hypothetical protein
MPEMIPGLTIANPESVNKILQIFHNGLSRVPFSPGEGVFAGILVAYMDDVRAFDAFLHLMAGPKRMALHYFDTAIVHDLCEVWDQLLLAKRPQVHSQFRLMGVRHEGYLTVWLRTAFLKADISPGCRLKLFDRFVAYGTRALFSFGLTLVDLAKKIQSPDELVEVLANPSQLVEDGKWDRVLVRSNRDWVTKTEYKEMFKRADVPRIP